MKLTFHLLFALAASVPFLTATNPDRVRIASGTIEGTGPNSSGVREFKGVPFAEPAVGNLRWAAPSPSKPSLAFGAAAAWPAAGPCQSALKSAMG